MLWRELLITVRDDLNELVIYCIRCPGESFLCLGSGFSTITTSVVHLMHLNLYSFYTIFIQSILFDLSNLAQIVAICLDIYSTNIVGVLLLGAILVNQN